MPPLILASTSAYRRELLERLRLPFAVQAPQVDETAFPGELPAQTARRLALLKASTVAQSNPQAVVIGSDQVADLDGAALGKPGNHENAVTQLRAMRGKPVIFHTAIAVVCLVQPTEAVEVVTVEVKFRPLSDAQIENYLRQERPYDCAGSAKCEGLGISLLEYIRCDDPTALIGLPLIQTCALLRQAGIEPLNV
ncbi:MAG: Maf family nucleotide pyrophosphatase [Burkholderiales bacterium]